MPYGRSKANKKNVAGQAALLSSKLNFGPPSKGGKDEGGGGRSNGVSKDPNFSANRNAIADKINFGGKQPPPERQPPTSSRGVSKNPNFSANKATIAGKLNFGGKRSPPAVRRPANTLPKPSGGKEFQNQKAALASKLNFRPPLPAGNPRIKLANAPPSPRHPAPPPRPAQHALAQNETHDFSAHRAAIASQLAFGKSKPASPLKPNLPPPRRNDNNGADFSNQKAELASKLIFRPPLPASSTSGGPQVSPLRPATGIPLSSRHQPPSPAPAPAPAPNMDIASQAAAMATRLKSQHPEDVTTTSSGGASTESARSINDPPPEPEMTFVRSYSIRKDSPPAADPEMQYAKSYRIGGSELPKEEPTPEVIPKSVGDENGRTQVLLVSEKYEWGTKPIKDKKYKGNRVMVKHFYTDEEAEQKRQRNKNARGGCTIM
ncbi:MAG: hypothetical protein SGBAC_005061 [Bacillariaceae sp.]